MNFRIPQSLSDGLDGWIADQPEPKPSRSEAIRQIITQFLADRGFLKGEKSK